MHIIQFANIHLGETIIPLYLIFLVINCICLFTFICIMPSLAFSRIDSNMQFMLFTSICICVYIAKNVFVFVFILQKDCKSKGSQLVLQLAVPTWPNHPPPPCNQIDGKADLSKSRDTRSSLAILRPGLRDGGQVWGERWAVGWFEGWEGGRGVQCCLAGSGASSCLARPCPSQFQLHSSQSVRASQPGHNARLQ